ncbi:hypothetical protein TNCV_1621381 [Trichonephila clavipes]|nr:hypothetical protein TNCV_1621381 [Trichonephila clavipes]
MDDIPCQIPQRNGGLFINGQSHAMFLQAIMTSQNATVPTNPLQTKWADAYINWQCYTLLSAITRGLSHARLATGILAKPAGCRHWIPFILSDRKLVVSGRIQLHFDRVLSEDICYFTRNRRTDGNEGLSRTGVCFH